MIFAAATLKTKDYLSDAREHPDGRPDFLVVGLVVEPEQEGGEHDGQRGGAQQHGQVDGQVRRLGVEG